MRHNFKQSKLVFFIAAADPYVFEIMDVSGFKPKLKVLGASSTSVQLNWNDSKWTVTITVQSGSRRAVAKVIFTGVVTEPDVFKGTSSSESCIE